MRFLSCSILRKSRKCELPAISVQFECDIDIDIVSGAIFAAISCNFNQIAVKLSTGPRSNAPGVYLKNTTFDPAFNREIRYYFKKCNEKDRSQCPRKSYNPINPMSGDNRNYIEKAELKEKPLT